MLVCCSVLTATIINEHYYYYYVGDVLRVRKHDSRVTITSRTAVDIRCAAEREMVRAYLT